MLLLLLGCAAHRQPAPAATSLAVEAPVALETADAAPATPEPASGVEAAAGKDGAPMGVAGGQVGQDGAPIRQVHWSEVQEKRRMVPRFPSGTGAVSADCTIRVTLGPDGNPTSAEAVTCPDPFLDSAVAAAMGSAWYPYKVDGVGVAVVFTMKYRFKPL